MKANVYVDGFNLFYGVRRFEHADGQYKWLDLARLCELMLPRDSINRIRYFTARVQPRPDDPQQAVRQQTYLRALSTIPRLSIHLGHFLSRTKRMALANPPPGGPRTVEVLHTEEKGSDVNIATLMLCDAFDGDYELAVVISNDSDLMLPIQTVRSKFRLQVGVLNPGEHRSGALNRASTFYTQISEKTFAASQFAHTLEDAKGRFTKPVGW